MFTCQNDEGVHVYLVKCWRGAYSSVGMLKGYLARERLGTPALNLPTLVTYWRKEITGCLLLSSQEAKN